MTDEEILFLHNNSFDKISINHLDEALFYYYKTSTSETYPPNLWEYLNKSFNVSHFQSQLIAEKLVRDGYVKSKETKVGYQNMQTGENRITDTIGFQITFEGVLFFESAFFIWKNKPYVWKRNKGIISSIWTVAKIIMIVLNAVAIIYLTYLQAEKSNEPKVLVQPFRVERDTIYIDSLKH